MTEEDYPTIPQRAKILNQLNGIVRDFVPLASPQSVRDNAPTDHQPLPKASHPVHLAHLEKAFPI